MDAGAVEPVSGLPVAEIRAQLDRILGSSEFHATDKMREFLRFVVEEKLAGRAARIKGYAVAVAVFGRGEDFDAAHDPIVRIQAGRLRRALERYYLVAGGEDPILIDIPKGRYVPRFAAHRQPLARGTRRPAAEAAPRTAAGGGLSVAVLPFENLTGDADERPLAVGLTEELVTELTRFQDIAVVSCHAERRPPGFPADPVEMARTVSARFVLEGTVRRDPSTVKVAAHLTDTTGGEQIWAQAFTIPLEASRLIDTQERLAASVVQTVASEFGVIARRLAAESRRKAPDALQTYEAMLRYYNHQIAPSPESAQQCFPALQAAAEREPEYGPVWSALATLQAQIYVFDAPGAEQALGRALDYARKGVFLDPGSQLARLILAYASHLADEVAEFREESEIAVSLNPNSPHTVGAVGYMHTLRGELEQGLPMLERAMGANPCHPAWFHAGPVIDHLLRGDYEQALADTRKHRPFISFWDEVMIAAMLGKLGRADEARGHLEAVRSQKPDLGGRVAELMHRGLKIDDLIDDLVDGLRRAGLSLGEETL